MKKQKINSPNKLRAPVFYQKNENEKNICKPNSEHSGLLFPGFYNMNDSPFSK